MLIEMHKAQSLLGPMNFNLNKLIGNLKGYLSLNKSF